MKLIHTADIHLKEHGDERWKALEKIIELANNKKCNIVTISGDLFDNTAQAEKLRGRIRELFAQTDAKVLIIPGNHDEHVFKAGHYFGGNVHIFDNTLTPFTIENHYFWGLPFSNYHEQEVLSKLFQLKNKIEETPVDDTIHFLLIHTELLDNAFLSSDYGDEGKERYMPVRLSYFENLHLHYILAGHFHTNCSIRKVSETGFFIYPGSPVSITKKEIGKRKVVFIDTEKLSPEEIPIDTTYYEEISIFLNPFQEENPLDTIKRSLSNLDKNSRLILKISGYINSERDKINEKALREQIDRILTDHELTLAEEPHIEYRDIGVILNDDIFKNFNDRLSSMEMDPETKNRLRELLIKAMIETL